MGTSDPSALEAFVEVRPVVMQDCPDAKNVFFVVGPQSFQITPFGAETTAEAEWLKEQFCHALRTLICRTTGVLVAKAVIAADPTTETNDGR